MAFTKHGVRADPRAAVAAPCDFSIVAGRVKAEALPNHYFPPQAFVCRGGEAQLEPLTVEVYQGPSPDAVADFQDFMIHHWRRVQRAGCTFMFIARYFYSAETLRGLAASGSRPTNFNEAALDTQLPVFACIHDSRVFVAITYWGCPERAPHLWVQKLEDGVRPYEFPPDDPEMRELATQLRHGGAVSRLLEGE